MHSSDGQSLRIKKRTAMQRKPSSILVIHGIHDAIFHLCAQGFSIGDGAMVKRSNRVRRTTSRPIVGRKARIAFPDVQCTGLLAPRA